MKSILKQWGLAIGVAFACCGCGNFLEQHSQNMAYLEHVEDLDELLLGECYLPKGYSLDEADAGLTSNWNKVLQTPFFPAIHLMDDDITEYLYAPHTELTYIRQKMGQLHYWQRDPWRDAEFEEITDNNWSATYRRIAVLNTILGEVEKFREADFRNDTLCDRIKGESLFLRAQYYFWLANLYARPYCKATAMTDGCVPLKITDPVEDRFFSRDPMEEVYGQMREDLLDAVDAFRNVEGFWAYRANQPAAFALLSRVYLYMERYEEAVAYADSVLKNNDFHLLDFNTRTDRTKSVMYASSPETLFTQGPNGMGVIHCPYTQSGFKMSSGYTTSEDLLNCYAENDLRLEEFFVPRVAPATGERCIKWREAESTDDEVSDCMAIRLPEVYLNKAEALALLGRDGEACSVINELRRNRIASDGYEDVNYSGQELVYFIRDERRRELCFEGHRWFDLRRYAVNTEYPQSEPIEHVSLAYVEDGAPEGLVQGKYVLNAYEQDAAAYVLPIPRDEIEFNEGALANEDRNERPMVAE